MEFESWMDCYEYWRMEGMGFVASAFLATITLMKS